MRNLFNLIGFLFISLSVNAQNLVPNSNFAMDSLCPTGGSQMNYCRYWHAATFGTSDYYNACDLTNTASVPTNFAGYQASGSGTYAGFYTYCGSVFVAPDYKEYIATTIPALLVGSTYKVTIVVSLADSMEYATDGIGVYFSTVPVDKLTLSTIPVTPQVDYSTFGVITDKVNWVTLTKNIIADSAYTNITIGAFKTIGTIGLNNVAPTRTDSNAYYFVDSVAVEKVTAAGISSVNNNNTLSKVYPDPVTENATLHFNYVPGQLYALTIYNIQGRVVSQMDNINTGDVKIDRQGLDNGFYFYRLSNSNTIVDNGRFIVR